MSTGMTTGRCTELMAGVFGHPLSCHLPHGHAGQHHDAYTGAHWTLVARKTWRTLWRRQTGMLGFLVEWVVWLNVVTAAFTVLAWVLRGTAWLLERVAS